MEPPPQTGFLGHPGGLRTLFFTEMWERFSYYGMRALLILFMTAPLAMGGLEWPTSRAGAIYGLYTSAVYLVSLPGGWLADRLIGPRRAVLWGALVIMLGHIVLAIPSMTGFYLGLLFVILGTGLLKPNISVLVGQLYAPDDVRRDAGFSLFYMGINLGAFLGALVTPWLAQSPRFRATLLEWGLNPLHSWHWGFGAAAVGMFAGIVWYLIDRRSLGEIGRAPPPPEDPEERASIRRTLRTGVGGTAALILLLALLHGTGAVTLTMEGFARAFGIALLLIVAGFFGWLFLANDWTEDERKRLVVITVLFVASAIFWSVFEQAGSTLNLFAARSTRNEIFGFSFPSGWWQSVNSMWIILLAPVFAWLWVRLGHRDPSSPAKFAIGLLLVGLSFVWMVPAAQMAVRGEAAGWWWLMGCFFLQTAGELCLSPVGLSAMTRLAPTRVVSLMMGVWFLATSVGSYLGGTVASLYDSFALPTLFMAVGGYAILFAILMAALIRPIAGMLRRSAA